ncbi:RxLR effector protein [Phytophthora megakarya]|uniref:RxLR effector protein n=1 Tax=Phytophthora megakarya TaxID=4795 RepID=A0A225WXV9_9STRA|nr:RxLR effector protein [Phytophthora megakarya]
MGLYQLVFLVAAVLIKTSNLVQASTTSQLGVFKTPTRARERDNSATRFLRAYTADEGVEEKRGISANLPGIKKISSILKSSKTKELERKIKADDSIDDAFDKIIRDTLLRKSGHIEAENAHDLLFLGKEFKVWAHHAEKMNKLSEVRPEAAMLATLMKTFSEKEIARMIYFSKDASWTAPNSVIKKLEKTQFNSWFEKGLDPTKVLETVLKVRRKNIHRTPTEKQIWGAYSIWYTLKTLNY